MFDLTGKNTLITGASGGIGGAIAKSLHAAGATVAISGTRRDPLEALAEVNIQAPAVPVVSNVRAAGVSDPDEIRELLVQQVTGSVRWRESVMWMASQGVDQIWEIGAGKALSGMVRRIDRAIDCKAIGTAADAAAAAQA